MPRPALLLASIALYACRGGDRDAPRSTVDTSATGVIHVSNSERGAWDAAHAWRLEEDLTVGKFDTAAIGPRR